jgi:hypothetical protein
MHLSLFQFKGNSQKESNDGVFNKTGGDTVVLTNLKFLPHISIVKSHHFYMNHFIHHFA